MIGGCKRLFPCFCAELTASQGLLPGCLGLLTHVANMLVLFETAAGLALFKVTDEAKLQKLIVSGLVAVLGLLVEMPLCSKLLCGLE